MTELPRIDELLALPINRRLELMEALWDSLSATPELVPVPDWHREVLEQRLAEDDTDPSPGEDWSQVRRRIENR